MKVHQRALLVCASLFLAIFLTSCAKERVVIQPEVVEVEVIKFRPVPSDLLLRRMPATIPMQATYSEILELYADDRATILSLIGQLDSIEALSVESPVE